MSIEWHRMAKQYHLKPPPNNANFSKKTHVVIPVEEVMPSILRQIFGGSRIKPQRKRRIQRLGSAENPPPRRTKDQIRG